MTGIAAWQTVIFGMYLSNNEDAARLVDPSYLFDTDLPTDKPLNELSSASYTLISLSRLGDEAYIKAGKAIDDSALANQLFNTFYDGYYNNMEIADDIGEEYVQYPETDDEPLENTPSVDDVVAIVSATNEYTSDELDLFRTWLDNNPGAFAVCQQEIISAQLNDLARLRSEVSQLSDFDYYVFNKQADTTLQTVHAETTADAQRTLRTGEEYAYLCTMDSRGNLRYSTSWGTVDSSVVSLYNDNDRYDGVQEGDIALIGLKASAVTHMSDAWQDAMVQLRRCIAALLAAGLVMLLCLIVVIAGAGRGAAAETPQLLAFDRIWTEAQGVVACLAGGLLACGITIVGNSLSSASAEALYALAIGASVAVMAVWLPILLSQVRRIKVKQWLNGWICWRLLSKYGGRAVHAIGKGLRYVRAQFRKTPLHRQVILLAFVVPLVCIPWITIPFVIAGILFFGLRAADRFTAICSGARDIRAGKTDTHIALTGGSKDMRELADNLNGISDGLNDAVSTAVKSERLKSELISNVSHDIKTPLTSIITYVDLLKRCDIPDPTAQEYIRTIDQKAKRLQTLTLDLFDASKASSGAMQVDLVKTDFDALLRQALGERADHLEKAGLDIRIQSQPLTYVCADGRLLWRILDNLLSNCARYALPNSRVYITVQPENSSVTLTIKNISAVELNIPAEELMQRFTRGDRSRHTEGSGLGLSIAQSLAELMHGSCQVEIDGDLFKASVTMPKWEEA